MEEEKRNWGEEEFGNWFGKVVGIESTYSFEKWVKNMLVFANVLLVFGFSALVSVVFISR